LIKILSFHLLSNSAVAGVEIIPDLLYTFLP
jgi:hypothetical protein